MAEAAAELLLKNMQNALTQHYRVISGSEGEVDLLRRDANSMSSFLKDLSKQAQREKGELLEEYEKEVRDVYDEAQDIIEECLTRAAMDRSSKCLRFLSPKHTSLANKVRSFRRDTVTPLLQKIEKCRRSKAPIIIPHTSSNSKVKVTVTLSRQDNIIGPTEGKATTSTQFHNQGSETESNLKRGSVVGFEEEADTIIGILLEESEQLEVVSIIGKLGSGKTILAQKIFEDKRIKNQFSKMIWVELPPQSYEKREVLLSIWSSLTQQDASNLSDDKLASTIKVYLQSQKFLLVLDGVRGGWEGIEAALPRANKLGKILITSPHTSVGEKANSKREPYELKPLDPSKSWDLLQLQVFDDLNICPQDLEAVGRIIAHECGESPLEIVVMGGILLEKNSTWTGANEKRIQWEKISSNVSKYLNDDKTRNLIGMSYNELPPDLRDCLLYMGMFPQQYHIPVGKLILLWIGEGFIWPQQGKSLEEVAYDNLKDLVDRNLVKVEKLKPNGYIKTCRVHDMIHDFCKNEASLEKQNLFQEMEMCASEGTFTPRVSEILNRRRLSVHSHVEDFLKARPKGSRVHSFVCFAKDDVASLPANTPAIPAAFTRLRVVDVIPIKLTEYPSNLTELIHLRYIALSGDGDDFKHIPKAFSRLRNLETVVIETKLPTIVMKANVWKMPKLRHFNTKASIILEKTSKGREGEQLQSLSRLSTKSCTKDVFKRAKNLKDLGIRGDLADILEIEGLRDLNHLDKLKLVHCIYPRVASERPLPCLPNPDRFPPNLKILQISGTFLPWNQVRRLANHPSLEVLILKNNAFHGKYWPAVDGCFATLEILIIESANLVVWTVKEGYFPKLKCLVLKDCKKLEEIPLQLTENLERLQVECVSESAAESAKKIAEEKHKAQQGRQRGGFKLTIDS